MAYNFRNIEQSLPNLAQIKVSSFWTSCQRLFKSTLEISGAIWWVTITLLQLQVFNWWSFLHHFSQPLCIVISLFY